MFYFPEIKYLNLIFFRIETYRVFAYLAAIIGSAIFLYWTKKKRLDKKQSWIIIGIGLFGLIFGARLFYYFGPWTWGVEISLLRRFIRFLQFGGSGLVFYGGLLGGFFAIYLYTKLRKMHTWKYLDSFAIATPIIIMFGRLGCFISNDSCRGIVTTLPWGVVRYSKDKILTEALHPATLYEALAMSIVFLVLVYLNKKNKNNFDGRLSMIFLMSYAVIRFFIEFIRTYSWHLFGLSASQIISIFVFVFALIAYLQMTKRSKISKKIKKRG